MFSLRKLLASALSLALVTGGATVGQEAPARSGFDKGNLDETCEPCKDFYQFANGGWMKKNPIPAAYPRWGTFNALNESNKEKMRGILEAAAANKKVAPGSNEKKIGDLYATCMDESAIEAAGLKPLAPLFAEVQKLKDVRGLLSTATELREKGVGVLFTFGVRPDAKNTTINIAYAGQGGLALPDRDYYVKQDDKSKETREKYVAHVARMFELLGDAPEKAAAEARTVLTIETKLAEASMDRVQRRNPQLTYNKKTVAELQQLTPNIAWAQFFKQIGHPEIKEVVVAQPDFFKALNSELTARPIEDWQAYLRWHIVHDFAAELPKKFDEENFNFYSKYLQGQKEQLPRWRRCVGEVDTMMGEALGQEYVKKYYPAEAKARMKTMIDNLLAVLKGELGTVSWMSEATRKQAIEKLEAFTPRIGHTEKWRNYATLKIDRASFIGNAQRVAEFDHAYNLSKVGKPVEKGEWGMTPPTVNAYYNPLYNEIVFPAGILQPPFFDFTADDAINYGAIGAVIGHEISHGFDDQGRQYDAKGNLRDWWTEADAKNYKERASCIEQQFSGYKVADGLYQNGKLVLGESIGDLGGLKLAYLAYKKSLAGKPAPPVIDGFTADQRFFLGWAQVWASNTTPEFERLQTQTDPHPLARFRVNGPLSNLPEFAAAFGCKKGDPMVRETQCAVW
jgi:putative endopeptidase